MAATIQINGVTTRETEAPFGVPISLLNAAAVGTSQTWEIVAYPADTGDVEPDYSANYVGWTLLGSKVLTRTQTGTYPAVTFTPDITGSYLIRLTSQEGSPVISTTVVRVVDAFSGDYIPAAGENLETNAFRGWAQRQNRLFRRLFRRTGKGTFTRVVNTSGASIPRGRIMKITGLVDAHSITPNSVPGGTTVKPEKVPNVALAHATDAGITNFKLCIADETIANNAFGWAQAFGVFEGGTDVDYSAFPANGLIYLSDTGTQSSTPGTVPVTVGRLLEATPDGAVFLDASGQEVTFAKVAAALAVATSAVSVNGQTIGPIGSGGSTSTNAATIGDVDAKVTAGNIATLAASLHVATTAAADIDATAGIVGTGTTAARSDHKHKVLTATPVDTGTANTDGTGTSLALATHVHKTSFAGVAAALATATTDVSLNNHRLTNLLDGVNPSDGATVAQATAFDGLTIEVDESADLSASPFPITGLVLAKVETFEDLFYLDRGNTQTADGITIITALGGVGRWIRMNIANVIWQAKTAWYWAATSGNDENSGDVGFPVKTHAEIERRCGTAPLRGDTIVHVLENTTEVPVIRRTPGAATGGEIPGTAILYYNCVPVPMVVGPAGATTGTVTAVTAENHATNTPEAITVAGLAGATDWTTLGLVNHFIRFSRLGVPVGTTFVQRDLGAKTAQIGAIVNVTDAPQFCATGAGGGPGSVQVNDTFQVLARVSLPPPLIPSGQCTAYHGVKILDTQVDAINSGTAMGPGVFYANICEFGTVVSSLGNCALFATYCYFVGADLRQGTSGRLNICHVSGTLNIHNGAWEITNDIRIFGSLNLKDYPGSETPCQISLWGSSSCITATNSRIMISLLWGSGNSNTALTISQNGSRIIFTNTPIIATSGSDLSINGIIHAWSEARPIGDLSTQNFVMSFGA